MGTFRSATIAERIDLTPELAVFRIAPPESIEFIPGQFVRLGLEVDGRMIQRSYSIVSAPHEPYLEFLLELVPDGRLTPLLWELKGGDSLLLHTDAAGVFTLDRKGGFSRHTLVATVTGIAPYVSMMRDHMRRMETRPAEDLRFLMLHGASNAEDLRYYGDEMNEIAGAEWLVYIPTISRPLENRDWNGEVGRVEELIRKYTDMLGFDYLNSVAYACGHPEMIQNARGILERARYPKGQIRVEKYFAVKR